MADEVPLRDYLDQRLADMQRHYDAVLSEYKSAGSSHEDDDNRRFADTERRLQQFAVEHKDVVLRVDWERRFEEQERQRKESTRSAHYAIVLASASIVAALLSALITHLIH